MVVHALSESYVDSDGSIQFDSLPLPALACIVSHIGTRPDALLRSCKTLWSLHADLCAWAAWMLVTYGPSEALHKLRLVKLTQSGKGHVAQHEESEGPVLAAVKLLLSSGAEVRMLLNVKLSVGIT